MFKSFAAFLTLPILGLAGQINLEEARKAVVFVAIESDPFELSYGTDPGYYDYLRPVYEYFWPTFHAQGSGFIISPVGYVITNEHVVEDATKVLVIMRTPDIQLCKATVLGKDPRSDIAILKLELEETAPLPYLNFGDSDQVKVGDQVILIGNPRGLESSVSVGVISEKNRNDYGLSISGHLQTDSALNPGNSGGPLLNSEGEVIGIACWSYIGISLEGLHFTIPSNTAKEIANQIITNGKITQGFLGVELEDNIVVAFNRYYFDRNEGARIESIIENSPAHQAGLQAGDLIVMVNDRPVQSSAILRNKVAILAQDTAISIQVYREGEMLEFRLVLGSDELSQRYSNLSGPSIIL